MLGFVFCFVASQAQSKKDSLAKSEFNINRYKPTPKDRMILELREQLRQLQLAAAQESDVARHDPLAPQPPTF